MKLEKAFYEVDGNPPSEAWLRLVIDGREAIISEAKPYFLERDIVNLGDGWKDLVSVTLPANVADGFAGGEFRGCVQDKTLAALVRRFIGGELELGEVEVDHVAGN